jgi:hypothetical protein
MVHLFSWIIGWLPNEDSAHGNGQRWVCDPNPRIHRVDELNQSRLQ